MNNRLPISVFIIALNEADRIRATIMSVRDWADEVIVIDSGSTDNTVQIAESLGARMIFHAWPGYGLQKRFGEDQCKNRWLLNLDADEEVTPALADEIASWFKNGEPMIAGFVLRVRDLLPGEKHLAPLAHTNFVLRLYNRNKARFSDSPVHDTVRVESGETRMLDHPVLHRSFRSLEHAVEKLNAYSSVQARKLNEKGLPFAHARLVVEIPFAFFKDYILRGYILRGRRGFVNSILYSFARFIRIAKYLELKDRDNT